jgi:hypothetical protein
MSSSSESEREDDSSVGSRFVDEDMLSDDDVEAWMERPRRYMVAKKGFMKLFRRLNENDPSLTKLEMGGLSAYLCTMTEDGWEQLGRVIASNSYLGELVVDVGFNLVDEKMICLFRGLTRSNSMKRLTFESGDGFGFNGIRSMVPFLQNSNNLEWLDVSYNDIQSEGFQLLLRALRNSPIKRLDCDYCDLDSIEIEYDAFPKKLEALTLDGNGFGVDGVRSLMPFLQNSNNLTSLTVDRTNITSEGFSLLLRALSDSPIKQLSCGCCLDSIEIDDAFIPANLKDLTLYGNNINTDGCRELAKLLHRKNATLEELDLDYNKIDDEGVAILADALQHNSTLEHLRLVEGSRLDYNEGITIEGMKMLLKLVCDVSSIKATLQSNHTLQELEFNYLSNVEHGEEFIEQQIELALDINKKNKDNPAAAGREKVIETQLNSQKRSELCRQQGIDKCNAALFSEIKPLHLPEVLALISRHHGQGELYVALVSSIVALFSTVNKMQCLQQQRAYHEAMLEAINAEIAAIE